MKEATVQKIINIEPINGADQIEVASILGWKVVVKKGEFKIGDLVVYIEIDSLLPVRAEFEFLRKNCYKLFPDGSEGFRVKTIKLRGQLSQGICFPLNILPNRVAESVDTFIGNPTSRFYTTDLEGKIFELSEGTDVTEILNIKHYEKSIPGTLSGLAKGHFPNFLIKTDETRIQSAPEYLEQLKEQPYYITIKMDGTSATYYYKNDTFGVCSRNLELKESEDNAYWRIAKKYNIEKILKGEFDKTERELCIQGEVCGPGIQKNPLQLLELDLFVFNVYDINGCKYFPFHEVQEFCLKNSLNMVPIIEVDYSFNYTQDELLERAKGKYSGTNNNREGIVIRSIDKSVSFKVINNDYLLKDEE